MSQHVESWVVYLKTLYKQTEGMRAVCSQAEWDEMERLAPGHHKLIQSGIRSEGEAERLARGTSGEPRPRKFVLR